MAFGDVVAVDLGGATLECLRDGVADIVVDPSLGCRARCVRVPVGLRVRQRLGPSVRGVDKPRSQRLWQLNPLCRSARRSTRSRLCAGSATLRLVRLSPLGPCVHDAPDRRSHLMPRPTSRSDASRGVSAPVLAMPRSKPNMIDTTRQPSFTSPTTHSSPTRTSS